MTLFYNKGPAKLRTVFVIIFNIYTEIFASNFAV